MFHHIRRIKHLVQSIVAMLLICGAATGYAQTVGVNKYLIQAASLPSPIQLNTNFGSLSVLPAQTFTSYAYVIQVNSSGGGAWSVTDSLPANFSVTGCATFQNGFVAPIATSATSSIANCLSGSTFPSGGLTVVIYGQFTAALTAGVTQVSNNATATVGASSNTGVTTTGFNYQPFPHDLSVTKTASATSTTSGSIVTYTVTVTNNSSVSLDLTGIVSLTDTVTNNTSGSLTIAGSSFSCTPATACGTSPSLPSATSVSSGAQSPLFANFPLKVLAAGASVTITYAINTTVAINACQNTSAFANTAFLTLGSGSGNLDDINNGNNTSSVYLTHTDISLCPPPKPALPYPTVTKKVIGTPVSTGNPPFINDTSK